MSERGIRLLVGWIAVAVVLTAWEFASTRGLVNPVLLPAPSAIMLTLAQLVGSGAFLSPLLHTLSLFAIGFTIALVLGVSFGAAMGTNAAIYGLLEPLVETLRPVPKSALVPALFLFLGIGETTMLTIIAFASFFPILIATLQGVRNTDPVLLETASTFRHTKLRTITRVILPSAMPMIISGARVSLGLGLVMVILAEMLAGETGLGFNILDLERSFRSREMYAWVFILIGVGIGLTVTIDQLEQWLIPWRNLNG